MKLSNTIPILRILDETKAREFYVGFLSFSIDWEHRFDDNFPLYLQASRDHCIIHLSEHHGDCNPGGAIRIETSEIDNINRELLQKHYKYAKPEVEQTSWKTREMKIIDPFGNRLIFLNELFERWEAPKWSEVFLDTHLFGEGKLCGGSADDAGWNPFLPHEAVPVAPEKILPSPFIHCDLSEPDQLVRYNRRDGG